MSSDFSMKVDPSRLTPTEAPLQKTEISKTQMGHTFSIGNEVGGQVGALGLNTLSKTAHESQSSQKFQSGPQDKTIGGAISTQTASSFLVSSASGHAVAKTENVSLENLSESQKKELAGRALGFLNSQKAKLETYLNRKDISSENRTKVQEKLSGIENEIKGIKSNLPGAQSSSQGIQAAKPSPGQPIIHLVRRF